MAVNVVTGTRPNSLSVKIMNKALSSCTAHAVQPDISGDICNRHGLQAAHIDILCQIAD